MSTPMTLDAAAVEALVAEVVRRIRAAQAPATATAPPAPLGPRPGASSGTAVSLADRVITLAHLERLPPAVRDVIVDARAVITPSAREHAHDAGITLIRGTPDHATAATTRPFVIAQAACRDDASTRAGAIARAVPGAQQLPASGLADVVAALAGHASKDAARGVLLTGRPAVAVVLANRSASLRAVTGRDAASLAAAAADTAANLLVVDPSQFATGSLERVCADFHRTTSGPPPAELAAASPGCGCKTHAH